MEPNHMERIDLHTHSTFSDGTFTPAELMRTAKEGGLRAVALTDHDTVAGLAQAEAAAREEGVELVNGVELAARHEDAEIHILGLMIDRENRPLLNALEAIREHRELRNEKMLAQLQAAGVHITREDLINGTGGSQVTRAHFANAIVNGGYCRTFAEAFSAYLSPGRPGYARRFSFGAPEIIALIHGAGGVAALAHPLLYRMNPAAIDAMTARLSENGLDAVEALYSTNTPADDAFLMKLANKYRLLITGGSDFHGQNKPGIKLGTGKGRLFVPYGLLARLRER